jgi:hypothetical protein
VSSDDVVKMSVVVPVSSEVSMTASLMGPIWDQLLVDSYRRMLGLPPRDDGRTPEQREADRAQYAAETRAKRDGVMREHQRQLAAVESAAMRAVLELHAPTFYGESSQYPTCTGCDMAGYECEAPDFPCRTYELITGRDS